ncbi:uncharacterized protein LOC120264678 [Dioscorea cayenensis subsp. rotundata]|uniref:Uncharacterized protein LOC120264678 n=1 Tax=Dioscorea cayennensis subsp. rotundata TaxID=55577 RepID=A0AB40BMC2_DIOCR|nr:uncharacterized protein LOC120264678 [Dioscorea cayenensis subsp. rotundata]
MATSSSSSTNYEYLSLLDAKKAIDININLLAVITEIGSPKKSRGSGSLARVRLLSQSKDNGSILSCAFSQFFFTGSNEISAGFENLRGLDSLTCTATVYCNK